MEQKNMTNIPTCQGGVGADTVIYFKEKHQSTQSDPN